MKSRSLDKKTILVYLILFYIGIVLTRFLLALVTSSFPTVGIDEYLYYSLGRSIATEGKLLFRGQSADYAYLLYPLILSPVYLLFPEGANFYRLLQLWNILLMSASVFPLFFLSKEILGSTKKVFLSTALSMLLPDFILGQLIFSEAIIFPLFFTLMYCAYIYIKTGKKSSILWVGFLGGLMYSTKPGAIVPAAVFLVITAVLAIVRKKGKTALLALCSALITIATAGMFWILAKNSFGYEGSFLSIYQSQIDGSSEFSIGIFFRTLMLYLCYFILACGIAGFIYPALSWRSWEDENKTFWCFTIASLAVMSVGSAWVVEQTAGMNNINLRYITSYVPLMILFCFQPETLEISKIKNKCKKQLFVPVLVLLLGFVIICCTVFGCKDGKPVKHAYPLLSLSLLNDRFLPLSQEWVGTALIAALCIGVFVLFFFRFGKKTVRSICLYTFLVCMLMNSIAGYSFMRGISNRSLEKDGMKIKELIGDKPYLYVLANEGDAEVGVDVFSKKNTCIVYTNDFINCLQCNDGVYVPYIPEIMRGMKSVRETTDTDTIVMDLNSFNNIQLSRNASAYSPYDRQSIYVIQFEKGKRMVDSTLSNLTQKTLAPNKPGIILLFDEKEYGYPVTIKLEIESTTTQTMTINSTHELYTVDLSPGRTWYEVKFNRAEEAFNFQVTDASIKVHAYSILPDEGEPN